MFRQSWLPHGLAATLALSLCSLPGLPSDGERPAQKASQRKPTATVIQKWVANLGSTDFEVREDALASLVEAGKPSIAPLAAAVMSSDPEVAWRAATALEAIGLTGDEATLAEIKARMEKTKGTPHRDLAAVLATLSQRWGEMQRVKAQTALTKLGATFPNMAGGGAMPVGMPAPVFMGSYASLPTYSSGTVVIDSFSFASPGIPVLPATPPVAVEVVEFDPLTLPSSVKTLTETIEDVIGLKEAKKDIEKKVAEDKKEEDAKEDDTARKEATAEAEKKEAAAAKIASGKKEPGPPPKEEKPEADSKPESKPDSKESIEAKEESSAEAAKPEEPSASAPAIITSDTFVPTDVSIDLAAPSTAIALDMAMATSGMPTEAIYPGGVRLDRNWIGEDAGLVHLTALTNITYLDIQDAPITDKALEHFKKMPALSSIMIRGTKMSPEALIKFAKEKPNVQIRGQSRGILGINSGDPAGECLVSGVTAGGPAGEAGVQIGDLIVKIDGKRVETFGQLTLWMMKREPGEEVKVTVKRGDELLEKKLKLGSREALSR